MSLRILLFTTMRWPFAARMAGAFAQAGARVEALAPAGHVLEASRYPARLYVFHPLFPRLAETLALARPDLVVPCDDPAALALARFARRAPPQLARRLAFSLGDPLVMPSLTGRNTFLSQATAAGVRVAETMAVADEAGIDRAIGAFGLPLVVKADQSWGGDGVAIAHDAETAQATLRRFSHSSRLLDLARAMHRREPHLLARALFPEKAKIGAQRFIAGQPATSSIAAWRGTLVAANHFDVVVSAGTGPATVVAPIACPQMADAAARIVRAFHLTGLFGLDYMRDAAGDIHLLEINPRATPTTHLPLAADPVAALVAAACGGGHPRPAATDAPRIALFPQECSRDPNSPWLQAAFHDVPRDDPGLIAACLPKGLNAHRPENTGKLRSQGS